MKLIAPVTLSVPVPLSVPPVWVKLVAEAEVLPRSRVPDAMTRSPSPTGGVSVRFTPPLPSLTALQVNPSAVL